MHSEREKVWKMDFYIIFECKGSKKTSKKQQCVQKEIPNSRFLQGSRRRGDRYRRHFQAVSVGVGPSPGVQPGQGRASASARACVRSLASSA